MCRRNYTKANYATQVYGIYDNSKSLNDKIKTRENKDVEPKRDGDPGQK